MEIYDAIDKLVDISKEKLSHLKELTLVCQGISLDIVKGDYEIINNHNTNRFELEILLSKLDLEFCDIMEELDKKGIDSFDKIDPMVYPNIKKLRNVVSEILEYEEKLSAIKLRNNQIMSDIERDSRYKNGKAVEAYKKQKLNKM